MKGPLIRYKFYSFCNAYQLSIWEGPIQPSISWWTCPPSIPNWRGTFPCMQILQSSKIFNLLITFLGLIDAFWTPNCRSRVFNFLFESGFWPVRWQWAGASVGSLRWWLDPRGVALRLQITVFLFDIQTCMDFLRVHYLCLIQIFIVT